MGGFKPWINKGLSNFDAIREQEWQEMTDQVADWHGSIDMAQYIIKHCLER